MANMGWRQDLAKEYNGQWPSANTDVAPAFECYTPIADRASWGLAKAYQWPQVPHSGVRREAEEIIVVYGQFVGWLQMRE